MSINLNKITLDKQGDSHRIDLTKRSDSISKEIVINLNWSKNEGGKKGFWASLFSENKDIDLDLGCFWALKEGLTTQAISEKEKEAAMSDFQKYIRQGQPDLAKAALGKLNASGRDKSALDALQFAHGTGGPRNMLTRQGCYTQKPWVWHTGDDRSGDGAEGENILVNPNGINELKRIIVYCYIYEGVARWSETNAVVTIKVPDNPDIVVEMGKQIDTRTFCAIADIVFDDNCGMTVKKLVSFHTGHEDCDRAYEWGMQYSAGSK